MKKKTEIVAVSLLLIGIVFIYVWYITAGKVQSQWPRTHNYYEVLSQAFLHGKLYILVTSPSAELLALKDPYDPNANKGLRVADGALYNGHFYLNWGPVPALIVSVLHLFTEKPVYDSFIVFGFLAGLLIFNTLIILWTKQHIFSGLPVWGVFPMILLAGLCHPIPWLLSRPAIYEAAITGGQFFLISGVYWALTALEKSALDPWKLTLAGISWLLAIGTRVLLLPAIFFLFFVVTWIVFRKSQKIGWTKFHSVTIALFFVPLIIGLFNLGFYNYMRFGSFFETGVQYTLTSGVNQHHLAQEGKLASAKYISPNFLNYIANRYIIKADFPYLRAVPGNSPADQIPNFQAEVLSGIIWVLPFLLFSLYSGGKVISDIVRSSIFYYRNSLVLNGNDISSSRTYIPILLGGGALFCFLPLLTFYGATMRYEEDFLPLIVLLSIWGFWLLLEKYYQVPIWRKNVITLAIVLAAISILIALLLGITSYNGHFETRNPELILQIRSVLNFLR